MKDQGITEVLHTWRAHHWATKTSWNKICLRYCNCHICPIGRAETSNLSASVSFLWKGENHTLKHSHVWMMQMIYCMTCQKETRIQENINHKYLYFYTLKFHYYKWLTFSLKKSMIFQKQICSLRAENVNKYMYMYLLVEK